jgi:hypothetical protein
LTSEDHVPAEGGLTGDQAETPVTSSSDLPGRPQHSSDIDVDRGRCDIHLPTVRAEQQPDADPAENFLTSRSCVSGRRGLTLDQLHALMGHYARQHFDLQQARIAQANRLRAMDSLTAGGSEYVLKAARRAIESLEQAEGVLDRQLESLAGQHPLGPWIRAQKGVGLPSFAKLLALTGPLDGFDRPSKFWKFCGQGVVDGHAPKRVKGQAWTHTDCKGGHALYCKPDCTRNHHEHCRPGEVGTAYSTHARTLCFLMGESIVKVGGDGPWRAAYDHKKAEYLAHPRAGESQCPFGHVHRDAKGKVYQCDLAHVHAAAKRYAVKQLLLELWHQWRAFVCVD